MIGRMPNSEWHSDRIFGIGVHGHGIGYTKQLPPGLPLATELTYVAPNTILTKKVSDFEGTRRIGQLLLADY